jgi:hypothetical protein
VVGTSREFHDIHSYVIGDDKNLTGVCVFVEGDSPGEILLATFFPSHVIYLFLHQQSTMSSRKTAVRRATTKKRAQRATSNVFAMFDQAQIAEFKVSSKFAFLWNFH